MDNPRSTFREELIKKVNLTPASAEVWVDEHLRLLNEEEFDTEFIEESVIGFLDESRASELRVVIDFLLPLFNTADFNPDMLFHHFNSESEPIPQYCKVDPGYLRMIMNAFPHIWGKVEKEEQILRVSQVAQMLRVSEAKVRQLALAGDLEFFRSQGETGHYRFKPEAVKEFAIGNGRKGHRHD